MDGDTVVVLIETIIVVISFLIGRYIIPKYKTNIVNAVTEFEVLLDYAESFCAYARQFLNVSGSEKMNNVVEKLKIVCEKNGIKVDDETLRAIGQKAYDSMIAGENSSKIDFEDFTTTLKSFPIDIVSDNKSSNTIENKD